MSNLNGKMGVIIRDEPTDNEADNKDEFDGYYFDFETFCRMDKVPHDVRKLYTPTNTPEWKKYAKLFFGIFQLAQENDRHIEWMKGLSLDIDIQGERLDKKIKTLYTKDKNRREDIHDLIHQMKKLRISNDKTKKICRQNTMMIYGLVGIVFAIVTFQMLGF